MSRTNETRHASWHKTCTRKCTIINNVGIVINIDVNAKNLVTKVDVMMDLFGILAYVNVNVNVISHEMLENI